jgi:glycosyltransferase involved in cell wall biosynthesis
MKLSILIAVHNAQYNLPILINELLKQDKNKEIEIVLSIDDGYDYKNILVSDERIKYSNEGINSGPAKARNRALEYSTGTHITLLDSDDFISENYISSIMENLKIYDSFALKTIYKKNNNIIRSLEEKYLDYNNFSSFLGSVHTVSPKKYTIKYLDYLGDDVIATLNVLAKKNGRIPVIEAEYINNINENSYCNKNILKFDSDYKEIIENSFRISKELKEDKLNMLLKKVFYERLNNNEEFKNKLSINKNLNYHEFVIEKSKNTSNLFGRWY